MWVCRTILSKGHPELPDLPFFPPQKLCLFPPVGAQFRSSILHSAEMDELIDLFYTIPSPRSRRTEALSPAFPSFLKPNYPCVRRILRFHFPSHFTEKRVSSISPYHGSGCRSCAPPNRFLPGHDPPLTDRDTLALADAVPLSKA